MKKIFLSLGFVLLVLSCRNTETKKKTIKCEVVSCEVKKIVTIYDEINRESKWIIKTSCGPVFLSCKPYQKGDSVEAIMVYEN